MKGVRDKCKFECNRVSEKNRFVLQVDAGKHGKTVVPSKGRVKCSENRAS